MNCFKCGSLIHPKRLELLPDTKTCTSCSDIEKKGCVDVVYHKTGNTIQIMDAESAERINKASERVGFGSMKSMRGGSNDGKTKVQIGQKGYIPRKPSNEDYERVGNRMMEMLEFHGRERILQMINDEFESRIINGTQKRKLIELLNQFKPDKPTKKYNKKTVQMDQDIEWVFRNWKNSKTYK